VNTLDVESVITGAVLTQFDRAVDVVPLIDAAEERARVDKSFDTWLVSVAVGNAYRHLYSTELLSLGLSVPQLIICWTEQVDGSGRYWSESARYRSTVLRELLNEVTGCDPELDDLFDAMVARAVDVGALSGFHEFYRVRWMDASELRGLL